MTRQQWQDDLSNSVFNSDMAYLRDLASRVFDVAANLGEPESEAAYAEWDHRRRVLRFAADSPVSPKPEWR